MRKTVLSAVLLLAATLSLNAQFYTNGADPSRLKWYSTETLHYKIIYPKGADSLARTYGLLLEQFREPTGHSIGITPGEGQRTKMPVVLHTHNVYSNGSVAWAPRRMDLYTVPEPYGSDPTPWEVQLVSHEPRHQAQLQLGYEKGFRIGSRLFGEGWNPVLWALYLDGPLGEGDAVAAETGLAGGTRARTADFLNYYRVAYDQGDFRTWNRWRLGSFKHYTPDYYTIGYMTVAGERVWGGGPLAVREQLDRAHKAPWKIAPYSFRAGKNFRNYAEKFNARWQEEDAARAPFMPAERLSRKEAFPVMYSSPVSLDGTIYAFRQGYTRTKELVRYVSGGWEKVMPFASHTSSLVPEPATGRIYWSETLQDPRWELDGKSIIRYYDTKAQKVFDLTAKGRLYNPQPSPDGMRLAAAEYPAEGGSAALVLNVLNGDVLLRAPAPSGVQATEFGWIGDTLYSLAVQDGGYAIYTVSGNGAWSRVIAPMSAKVVNLGYGDDFLEWVSDATGVNELYRYYPSDGRLVRVTNTRYGATDFCEEGEYLYYITQALDGTPVMRTPVSELPLAAASVTDSHTYPVEDALTAQENAMGGVDLTAAAEFSEPVRYRKLLHPLRFHTWLPLYVNHESIMDASFDFTYDNAAPGFTLFFQNDLGTLSGAVGYSLHPDPDRDEAWRNALHAKLTYTGLFPVLEASLDFGDEAARQYRLAEYDIWGHISRGTAAGLRNVPSLVASFKAYVPLSYGKGGFLYGITPQLRYTISNNLYSTAALKYKAPSGIFADYPAHFGFGGFGDGRNMFLHSASASLRGYFMLPRPHSRVYPKLGIGAEAGIIARPGLTDIFTPTTYGYLYGYLPGLYQTHGIRVTGMIQQQKDGAFFQDSSVSTLPRGFDGSVASLIAASNAEQWRITADYAIPFSFGDISLMPVTYIRSFLATPHFDFTGFAEGNLWSAGVDIAANVGAFAGFAVDATIGVSASFLGGTWFGNTGLRKPWYIGLVFDTDF
ncbi:MAG: hypothetical protein J6W94_04740 [Bacteroidales bacterium]|nr:hypothetical protein [Bacteroidales bacterium]